nr:hypothetical protein [Niallia taxi]
MDRYQILRAHAFGSDAQDKRANASCDLNASTRNGGTSEDVSDSEGVK